jgi:ElaA protein
MGPTIAWQWSSFQALSKDDVYAILARRQEIFVVEQHCAFQDIDGYDQEAYHLLGWQGDDDAGEHVRPLAAYLRCLPPGIKYPEVSLGRVLCVASARGGGLGRELLVRGIAQAERQFPQRRLRVSAQQHLEALYRSVGFASIGAPYDEDGIAHVDMVR